MEAAYKEFYPLSSSMVARVTSEKSDNRNKNKNKKHLRAAADDLLSPIQEGEGALGEQGGLAKPHLDVRQVSVSVQSQFHYQY